MGKKSYLGDDEHAPQAYDPIVRSPPCEWAWLDKGFDKAEYFYTFIESLILHLCNTHYIAISIMAMKTNYKQSYTSYRPSLSLSGGRGTTGYDESGQVFTEIQCCGGSRTADWYWKTKGSPIKTQTLRSRSLGCSSLVHMATRSVLENSYNITPESLEGVPWELASMLWHHIVTSYDI